MSAVHLILAFYALTVAGSAAVEGIWAQRYKLRRLDATPPEQNTLPGISIIVPARNEAAHVEAAMRTLLALDYPNLEIIAINDRSTDATGKALDALASANKG